MIIAVDIETSCGGSAEYRHWRKGFQIDSIACSWKDQGESKSWFSNKPREVDAMIRRLAETKAKLVVHNLSFELGVFSRLYPDLEFNWHADTMRLAQLDDNYGGNRWEQFVIKTADDIMDELLDELDGEKAPKKTGMGLEACATRYLAKEYHNHKGAAHTWLEENHKVTSNHGSHLHLLPYDQLKQYNIADTDTTLALYEQLTENLILNEFDWQQDWVLYHNRVKLMQGAYIRGLKVNREKLKEEIYKLDAEIRAVTDEFFSKTQDSRVKWAALYPGKVKKRPTMPDSFNIGSNAQLKQLFIGALGIVGGKFTASGVKAVESGTLSRAEAALQYPSFASKHLSTWGPLGEILYKRRKLLLVLQQMLGVYLGSTEDGRLHPEIRASGTATNRVAGGKGVE